MAYIPTEWETGDVITAAKLNNMEQGIEDAFVAPAVTIADEGDVLTVNSSGEWAAATPASPLPAVTIADEGDVLTVNSSGEWAAAEDAHAKDTLVFNGTIEIPLTLDSGTVTITDEVPEDLLDYKYVGLALDVPSLQTPGTFMARLILPLYVVTYGGANIASCQFKCSFEVLSHIVHVDILYQYATETWSATVTSESA